MRNASVVREESRSPGLCGVLAVGLRLGAHDLVASLVARAAAYQGLVRLHFEDRLPRQGLEALAAILIDAMSPAAALKRLARDVRLAWRVRVLVDFAECSAERLWAIEEDLRLTPLAIRDDAGDAAAEELARLLFSHPVTRHVTRILDEICSPEQRRVVVEFLRRTGRMSPRAVARARAESSRSLRRECAALGLVPPRNLARLTRVLQGLMWMVRHRGTVQAAALVAGYSRESAFRRAAEEALDANVGDLTAEWRDPPALQARLASALFRSDVEAA